MTTDRTLSLDDLIPATRFERELEQRGIATRGQFRWWVRYRDKNGLKVALSERHGRIFVIRPRFVEWLAGNHDIRQPRGVAQEGV